MKFLFMSILLTGALHAQDIELRAKHEIIEINKSYVSDLAKCDALHADLIVACKQGIKDQSLALVRHAASQYALARREKGKEMAEEEECVIRVRKQLDEMGVSYLPNDDCETLKGKRDGAAQGG